MVKKLGRVKVLLSKFCVTAVIIYFLYLKIDFIEVFSYCHRISVLSLLTSFCSIAISQVFSAARMRYYYVINQVPCTYNRALKLYWVGMFYNLILPGGIGGDGYKMYLVNKSNNVSYALSLRLFFANRLNGLWVLIILALILYFIGDWHYRLNIIILLLLVLISYPIFAFFVLKENIKITFHAACYSFFVQLFSLFSAMIILLSLATPQLPYLILFLISSLVQILPISIAGIGMREMTFIYGSDFFDIEVKKAITFSMIYFFINFLVSMSGIFFIYQEKKLKINY